MLTVIFGAGASYDSDPFKPTPYEYDDRPPLARELFDQRFAKIAARYRRIAPITNDIRRRVADGENIETVLTSLEGAASTYPVIPSQLMAIRFYLRDLIDETTTKWAQHCSGATNYSEFVNRINAWSHDSGHLVNYITFNYDFLLEEGLIDLGQRFDDLEDYIKPPAIGAPNVIRPHGCVRWRQVMRSTTSFTASPSPDEIISKAIDLTPADDFTIDQPSQLELDSLGNRSITVPAIAIPVDNKQRYVCPERHVNTLREILRGTRTILVIGWRGTDPHFLEELQSLILPKTNLIVCNGTVEDSAETIRAMGLNQTQMRTPIQMGFSELPPSSYLKEVLRLTAS